MATLSFDDARACVIEKVTLAGSVAGIDQVEVETAAGRVLAEDACADRDYPAVARSVRDGFAIRATEAPGEFEVIGEVRAGEQFEGEVGPNQAVEIMTGASVPRGADAVIMVEHVTREGSRIYTARAAAQGQFINARGCECRKGDPVLRAGKRLDFTDIAMLASFGKARVPVHARPRVALLATGDEIVPLTQAPRDFQIRNSNVYSLSAQVVRAGGAPEILPVARDDQEHTRTLIERGLAADLLLISGGVSAGKYDLVERVLATLGAEFFFDRVLIQPGQPLVFGRTGSKFFFGLPGNPASTMVTFELFARAALELLGGQRQVSLPITLARLTRDFRHKIGLTRFLPACVSDAELTPIPWRGSSDVPALTRANAFLIAQASRAEWQAGELMPVLLK